MEFRPAEGVRERLTAKILVVEDEGQIIGVVQAYLERP